MFAKGGADDDDGSGGYIHVFHSYAYEKSLARPHLYFPPERFNTVRSYVERARARARGENKTVITVNEKGQSARTSD